MTDEFHITRAHNEELDALLGNPFKVLDKGFIRLIDYMGSDNAIVQAARVSYGKGTKEVNEDPRAYPLSDAPPPYHTI